MRQSFCSLHGFPSAGHMFRNLIPQLMKQFRIIASDLPGFGQSDLPNRDKLKFHYTFNNITRIIDRTAVRKGPPTLPPAKALDRGWPASPVKVTRR